MTDEPRIDWSLMATCMPMLQEWERRLVDMGIHDNCRCEGLTVKFFMDGSGEVFANYSKLPKEHTKEQHMIAMVFTEDHEVLAFDSLEELHGALVAQTMQVRRSDA